MVTFRELSSPACQASITGNSLQEMLYPKFPREFIKPNPPINLRLLTNSKSIRIGKDVGYTFKGFTQIRFVVRVSFEEGYIGMGG